MHLSCTLPISSVIHGELRAHTLPAKHVAKRLHFNKKRENVKKCVQADRDVQNVQC